MPRASHGAWLRNASEVPVYDMHIRWYLSGGEECGRESIAVLPPTDHPHFVRLSTPPENFGTDLFVRVAFRDASGRGWVRAEDGRLSSSEADPRGMPEFPC